MPMMTQKCGQTDDRDTCLAMKASPIGGKTICKWADDDDEPEGPMPPADCECVAEDNLKWPAKCHKNPGGKMSVCYVDRSAEKPCAAAKLSSKSKLRYVKCEGGEEPAEGTPAPVVPAEESADSDDVLPFKNFDEYKALVRLSPDQATCKIMMAPRKGGKCAPPKMAKKIKCKKVSDGSMCQRFGCTFKPAKGKKKSKCSGKPKNIMG